jgi:hypothetical protein
MSGNIRCLIIFRALLLHNEPATILEPGSDGSVCAKRYRLVVESVINS